MSVDRSVRQFHEAWGKIVSGDLGLLKDGFFKLKWRGKWGRQWFPQQALLTSADAASTFIDLTERVLSVRILAACHRLLFSEELGTAAVRVRDLLLRWAGSTDPNLQEKAALLWLRLIRVLPEIADTLARNDAVSSAVIGLFTRFDMRSLQFQRNLRFTLRDALRGNPNLRPQTSRVLTPCAYLMVEKMWRDTAAYNHPDNLFWFVVHDPRSLLTRHQFDFLFRYLASSEASGYANDILDEFLSLPREQLGGTNLTSLFIRPDPVKAFRSIFTQTDSHYQTDRCSRFFLRMWLKLAAAEPHALVEMIRADFLSDTLTLIANRSYNDRENLIFKSFFPLMIRLLDEMLVDSKQDAVEYFFSRGFFKILAAMIKKKNLPLAHFSRNFLRQLNRIICSFENAAPTEAAGPLVTAVMMPTASAISHDSTTAPAGDEVDGCLTWVLITAFDDISLAPVPIDNLEAFAASSGNKYIASFFVDLLAPTPGDETLSHNEKWAWLVNPNPLCLVVLRHLLRDKPATKKAMFAAAGIHEMSRNARDFEQHPSDPARSYYRDEQGNEMRWLFSFMLRTLLQ